MLTRWNGWANPMSNPTNYAVNDVVFHELRNRLSTIVDDLQYSMNAMPQSGTPFCPPCSLYETGSELILKANVPGISEKNLEVIVNDDMVTLRGVCDAIPAQGYAMRSFERAPINFCQSFALPISIKADTVSAQLKDGVLTILAEKRHKPFGTLSTTRVI